MRKTVDKSGRLVIPRALLDCIGLTGGGEVEVEVDGTAIRIAPVSGEALQGAGGLLVIPATGMSVDDTLLRELMDSDRHRR